MKRHTGISNICLVCFIVGLSACSEWSNNKITLVAEGQKKVLVALEERYTVTSSRSGGGMSVRSGYTNFFLKAYNPETGKKLKSVKVGDSKNRISLIGQTGSKLWFYSNYKEIGLHSRDAFSLKVLDDQKQLMAKNPSWTDEFIKGSISADSYYQYDADSGLILFTSASGQFYALDPQKLTIQPRSQKPGSSISNYYNNQAFLKDSLEFRFEGDTRRYLVIEKVFLQLRFDKLNDAFNAREEKRRVFLDQLYRANESNSIASADYIRVRDSVYQVQRMNQDSLYKFRDTFVYGKQKEEKYPQISFLNPNILVRGGESFKATALSHKSGKMIFVLSDSKIGDDKVFQITEVALAPQVAVKWTTRLEDLHEDSRSISYLTGVEIQDDFLYLAFKKDLICINIKNGQIQWRKQYD